MSPGSRYIFTANKYSNNIIHENLFHFQFLAFCAIIGDFLDNLANIFPLASSNIYDFHFPLHGFFTSCNNNPFGKWFERTWMWKVITAIYSVPSIANQTAQCSDHDSRISTVNYTITIKHARINVLVSDAKIINIMFFFMPLLRISHSLFRVFRSDLITFCEKVSNRNLTRLWSILLCLSFAMWKANNFIFTRFYPVAGFYWHRPLDMCCRSNSFFPQMHAFNFEDLLSFQCGTLLAISRKTLVNIPKLQWYLNYRLPAISPAKI